ncbi:MAG: hypothetical protein JW994_02875 [Candidatus Omnitrophica bacterium]|nr:hypothetical protein [Candidatus Omnitrophota bacterium]
MRISGLAYRANLKEIFPVVLFVGIYLFSYYPSVIGEYVSAKEMGVSIQESGISKNIPVTQESQWHTIKSNNFTVYLRPTTNLASIEKKLRRRGGFYIGDYPEPRHENGIDGKIGYRMDVLFKRAKDILSMYPRINDIKVKVFSNRRELIDEYQRIFGTRENLISFYVYKFNTIYTTEDDISDSVVAHEMGHAIVDHYFAVRPPEKIRELLAQYVDLHLQD